MISLFEALKRVWTSSIFPKTEIWRVGGKQGGLLWIRNFKEEFKNKCGWNSGFVAFTGGLVPKTTIRDERTSGKSWTNSSGEVVNLSISIFEFLIYWKVWIFISCK